MNKVPLCAFVAAFPAWASAAPPGEWAHVGNTVNSAIFVDRAVLREGGAERRFRTLHINVQLTAGWRSAEHRGTINCAARTLRYEGVVLTKADGRREVLPSTTSAPVPFPPKGVMRTFTSLVCRGQLRPPIRDPEFWTRRTFRGG